MKFRYKVLFTNLILLSLGLGLVGYLMIHKNFELAKQTQLKNAIVQNNLVQSSVEYELLAGLYYHYGIPKHVLPKKKFGVYAHHVKNRKIPLVRGFDDVFYAPHSRHTEVLKEDILKNPELTILAESDDAGVFLLMDQDGKKIFVMGHPEYDRYTLHNEYERDKKKGLDIDMPVNYYPDNDDTQKPLLQWRSHGNILYSNWLNYYVYQEVPYEFINNREIIGK